ncbi:galactose-3-O-sulfotransferase 1 [Porites harrisoni]
MIRKRLSKCVLGLVVVNCCFYFIVFYLKFDPFSFGEGELPFTRQMLLENKAGEGRGCSPKKNVVFLKTHKTGSSTVTNILNRFGDKNNLVFVVPTQKYNRLGWPWLFHEDYMIHYNHTKPNMLCSHARYNRAVLERVMPNDTVYVTILRDPVKHFESTFSYMEFSDILGISNETDPLETFFDSPNDVLVNYVLTKDLRINSDRLKLIRNGEPHHMTTLFQELSW